jgi:putative nucleotidyltransferase with HDIG domain
MASSGSSSSGWFSKLLGREEPPPPPPPPAKRPGSGRLVRADSSRARTQVAFEDDSPPGDPSVWANQALQSMLQVKSLPSTQPKYTLKDARARILEACELDYLPALQSLANGFTQTISRTDVSVPEIVASIEKDSALCVRVLRMANSAAVSSQQRIDKLETAIQMLGIERVRQTAEAILILRTATPKPGELDMRQLWIHALATAALSAHLEKLLRTQDSAPVYVGGLLHDVGKIVLSMIEPDRYRDLLLRAWNEKKSLSDLERERLGIDHCEAGLAFAKQNKLGPITTECISRHASPALARGGCRFEVSLVNIANYVAKEFSLGFSGYQASGSRGFETLPAWPVLEAELGYPLDIAALGDELKLFIKGLRVELSELREGF